MSFCDEIREAAAAVAARARSVRIDADSLAMFADVFEYEKPTAPDYDLAHHHRASEGSTLAFIVTLDTINFGSGYWPVLRKRPGLSGYMTVATSLKERFDSSGPWSASELVGIEAREVAECLGQDASHPEIGELVGRFARALRDLGGWLTTRFGGRFEGLVEESAGSAERMAALLSEMPFYHDVHRYGGLLVPLFKRAQIVPADLALAFAGEGPGRFSDLDRLTIFADNLVPHVLRRRGVLRYSSALAETIERGELLLVGSGEEVEIRAVALHAVELLVADLRARGLTTSAREIDQILWVQGQDPAVKRHPRHRCRSVYY